MTPSIWLTSTIFALAVYVTCRINSVVPPKDRSFELDRWRDGIEE